MSKPQTKKPKGHWPLGKRRNADVRPPKGWPDLSAYLEAVRLFCADVGGGRGRRGRLALLAEHLGVHHSSVQAWLSGRKWPTQERVDQVHAWLRSQTRSKHA